MSQRNLGLVIRLWTSMAASTASTAMATQRPGCRTGMALISSGGMTSDCCATSGGLATAG